MRALQRRSGAPTTSARSTLSTAVGNYRYANPMAITPSNNRTHTFWRTTQVSIPITESTGFAATSPSLNFGFALGQVWCWLNGSYNGTYSAAISNYTEFNALFDFYKINFVKATIFFTNNSSSVNSPATGMPMIHLCNDFDDVTEVMTVATILEKSGVRTLQFDATNSRGLTHWVKPTVASYIQTTDGGGTGSATNAGVQPNQWINTGAANIVHSGMKFVYNNQGRASATDVGSMTVIFEIEYVFKAVR